MMAASTSVASAAATTNGNHTDSNTVYGYIDVLQTNGQVQKTYLVNSTKVTVGRDHKADIRFVNNAKMSRHQCEIIINPAKEPGNQCQALLINKSSKLTTLISGKTIDTTVKVRLLQNMEIRVVNQDIRWRFYDPADPRSIKEQAGNGPFGYTKQAASALATPPAKSGPGTLSPKPGPLSSKTPGSPSASTRSITSKSKQSLIIPVVGKIPALATQSLPPNQHSLVGRASLPARPVSSPAPPPKSQSRRRSAEPDIRKNLLKKAFKKSLHEKKGRRTSNLFHDLPESGNGSPSKIDESNDEEEEDQDEDVELEDAVEEVETEVTNTSSDLIQFSSPELSVTTDLIQLSPTGDLIQLSPVATPASQNGNASVVQTNSNGHSTQHPTEATRSDDEPEFQDVPLDEHTDNASLDVSCYYSTRSSTSTALFNSFMEDNDNESILEHEDDRNESNLTQEEIQIEAESAAVNKELSIPEPDVQESVDKAIEICYSTGPSMSTAVFNSFMENNDNESTLEHEVDLNESNLTQEKIQIEAYSDSVRKELSIPEPDVQESVVKAAEICYSTRSSTSTAVFNSFMEDNGNESILEHEVDRNESNLTQEEIQIEAESAAVRKELPIPEPDVQEFVDKEVEICYSTRSSTSSAVFNSFMEDNDNESSLEREVDRNESNLTQEEIQIEAESAAVRKKPPIQEPDIQEYVDKAVESCYSTSSSTSTAVFNSFMEDDDNESSLEHKDDRIESNLTQEEIQIEAESTAVRKKSPTPEPDVQESVDEAVENYYSTRSLTSTEVFDSFMEDNDNESALEHENDRNLTQEEIQIEAESAAVRKKSPMPEPDVQESVDKAVEVASAETKTLPLPNEEVKESAELEITDDQASSTPAAGRTVTTRHRSLVIGTPKVASPVTKTLPIPDEEVDESAELKVSDDEARSSTPAAGRTSRRRSVSSFVGTPEVSSGVSELLSPPAPARTVKTPAKSVVSTPYQVTSAVTKTLPLPKEEFEEYAELEITDDQDQAPSTPTPVRSITTRHRSSHLVIGTPNVASPVTKTLPVAEDEVKESAKLKVSDEEALPSTPAAGRTSRRRSVASFVGTPEVSSCVSELLSPPAPARTVKTPAKSVGITPHQVTSAVTKTLPLRKEEVEETAELDITDDQDQALSTPTPVRSITTRHRSSYFVIGTPNVASPVTKTLPVAEDEIEDSARGSAELKVSDEEALPSTPDAGRTSRRRSVASFVGTPEVSSCASEILSTPARTAKTPAKSVVNTPHQVSSAVTKTLPLSKEEVEESAEFEITDDQASSTPAAGRSITTRHRSTNLFIGTPKVASPVTKTLPIAEDEVEESARESAELKVSDEEALPSTPAAGRTSRRRLVASLVGTPEVSSGVSEILSPPLPTRTVKTPAKSVGITPYQVASAVTKMLPSPKNEVEKSAELEITDDQDQASSIPTPGRSITTRHHSSNLVIGTPKVALLVTKTLPIPEDEVDESAELKVSDEEVLSTPAAGRTTRRRLMASFVGTPEVSSGVSEILSTPAPTRTVKTPAKSAKTSKSVKTPVKSTKTSKPVKTPVRSAKTPVKAAKTPMKASKTPVKASKTPVKAVKTPMKASKTPMKASKTPVKVAKTPVQVAKSAKPKTPARSASTPSKLEKTPIKSAKKVNKSKSVKTSAQTRAASRKGHSEEEETIEEPVAPISGPAPKKIPARKRLSDEELVIQSCGSKRLSVTVQRVSVVEYDPGMELEDELEELEKPKKGGRPKKAKAPAKKTRAGKKRVSLPIHPLLPVKRYRKTIGTQTSSKSDDNDIPEVIDIFSNDEAEEDAPIPIVEKATRKPKAGTLRTRPNKRKREPSTDPENRLAVSKNAATETGHEAQVQVQPKTKRARGGKSKPVQDEVEDEEPEVEVQLPSVPATRGRKGTRGAAKSAQEEEEPEKLEEVAPSKKTPAKRGKKAPPAAATAPQKKRARHEQEPTPIPVEESSEDEHEVVIVKEITPPKTKARKPTTRRDLVPVEPVPKPAKGVTKTKAQLKGKLAKADLEGSAQEAEVSDEPVAVPAEPVPQRTNKGATKTIAKFKGRLAKTVFEESTEEAEVSDESETFVVSKPIRSKSTARRGTKLPPAAAESTSEEEAKGDSAPKSKKLKLPRRGTRAKVVEPEPTAEEQPDEEDEPEPEPIPPAKPKSAKAKSSRAKSNPKKSIAPAPSVEEETEEEVIPEPTKLKPKRGKAAEDNPVPKSKSRAKPEVAVEVAPISEEKTRRGGKGKPAVLVPVVEDMASKRGRRGGAAAAAPTPAPAEDSGSDVEEVEVVVAPKKGKKQPSSKTAVVPEKRSLRSRR